MRFNTKKVLAMTLAVLMIFSTFVVTISAETGDAQTGSITPDTSWYDESKSEYVLDDAADLLGFMQIANQYNPMKDGGYSSDIWAGKTIKLAADVDLNPGWDATVKVVEEVVGDTTIRKMVEPAAAPNVWLPISRFSGTFDGQGHTISGMYINYDAIWYSVAMFANPVAGSTIKDFVLTNSYIYGHLAHDANLRVGAIAGSGYGTIENVYTDAYVFADAADPVQGGANAFFVNLGGINGRPAGTIRNCVFAGKLGVRNSKTDMTLDTVYNGDNQNCWVGGIAGGLNAATTIDNCLVLDGFCLNKMDSGVTSWKLGDFNADSATVTNCVKGAKGADWEEMPENWEYNVFIGYAVPKTVSAFFDGVITPDTSWYDASKSEYVLYDAADLLGFMKLSADTEPVKGASYTTSMWSGKTIKLGADIDLNPGWDATVEIVEEVVGDKTVRKMVEPNAAPNTWTPIAAFNGTFDGDGHTISGLYINYDTIWYSVAMFANPLAGSSIKNFALTNSYVYAHLNHNENLRVGSIAGSGYGTIENIYTDANVFADVTDSNGAVGFVNIGGINGRAKGTIRNCVFAGQVGIRQSKTDMTLDTMYNGHNQNSWVGGIAGSHGEANSLTVENCMVLDSFSVMHMDAGVTSYHEGTITGEGGTITTCFAGPKGADWDEMPDTWEYNAFLGYAVPKTVSAYFSSIRVQEGTGSNAGAVRFIGLIGAANLDDFASISLKITMTYGGKSYVLTENINTVYTSLIANSKTVYAEDLGASYMYAVEVYGLGDAESDVTFTVENIIDGSVVDTASWTYAVS